MRVDVLPVFDQLVPELLLQVDAAAAQPRDTVDDVHDEVPPVEIVQHRHVKRGRDGSLLFVPPDVDVAGVGAAIGQTVDQRRICKGGENDRLVTRKQAVKV